MTWTRQQRHKARAGLLGTAVTVDAAGTIYEHHAPGLPTVTVDGRVIEGVVVHLMPGMELGDLDLSVCAGCGRAIEAGSMCWGVPGQGCYHDGCLDPEAGDA